jgi:hypothetical protein
MTRTTTTRRNVLTGIGAAITATAVPMAATARASEQWTAVKTPTGNTLHDVAYTNAGAYAVGGGGLVLKRTSEGWTKILDGGPTGNGNDIYGADVTDDGKRLWFVGASGAIGEYDVETGNLEDRSAPNDHTSNFTSVAVTGPAGEADVYVADDSGAVHYSFANGETGTWEYEVPGSGDSLNAIDFHGSRAGHVIAEGGNVFATDDGTTWNRIGLEDANVSFYGLDSDAFDDVSVSGGNATVHRYDGSEWTPTNLGDADLRDLELDGSDGYAVGSGGVVFELDDGDWVQNSTPAGENLKAVVRGGVDIAVGAGGTVLEK